MGSGSGCLCDPSVLWVLPVPGCCPAFPEFGAAPKQLGLIPAVLAVVKRLPEHVQVDDPAAQRKLAKKLERQQVGGGLGDRLHTGAAVLQRAWGAHGGTRACSLKGRGELCVP